jgi:hypothetical protein
VTGSCTGQGLPVGWGWPGSVAASHDRPKSRGSVLAPCARLEPARPGAALGPYQQTSDGLARWEAALGAVTTFRAALRWAARPYVHTLNASGRSLKVSNAARWRLSSRRLSRHLTSTTRRLGCWHPWDGTPAELRPVVVLGDGARWISDHVATLFGGEVTERSQPRATPPPVRSFSR